MTIGKHQLLISYSLLNKNHSPICKTKKKLFGFIPSSRPSTAFGYAQITNPTWEWYKNKTGNQNASRANFNDVTDFIGWYTNQSENMVGISKKITINI